MVVDKNAVMMRNANGELLPLEIESDLFKGSVKILPLTLGDFNDLSASGKIKDEDLIAKYLIEPKLTSDEIKSIPLKAQRELITLIMMSSGMEKTEVESAMKVGVIAMQERLKKA